MANVKSQIPLKGVLIFATGKLFDDLKKEMGVVEVTAMTPDSDLRQMDKKSGSHYPVYLINEEYGIRGLDFRAPNNNGGICMIICSAFSKMRNRN